jgi:aerobic-type carbon monoxide dehydrogenase small subunit (CoxS/CutS family)
MSEGQSALRSSAPTHLSVNRTSRPVDLLRDRSLLHVLREELGLTGTKYGCGEGECGACTVLVDGVPTRSCVTPVRDAVGHEVTTIEGIAPDSSGGLHRVQNAFLEAKAFQCGFCTPGMIVAAVALLRRNPTPSEAEIRSALNGNICRCCGYTRIIEAVQRAAEPATAEPSRSV